MINWLLTHTEIFFEYPLYVIAIVMSYWFAYQGIKRETLGQVFGLIVRSRGLGGNIMAALRSIVGGEIVEYTEMLEDARRHALDRMVKNAAAMGANAIVRMQFDSSELGTSMSEIVAYG